MKDRVTMRQENQNPDLLSIDKESSMKEKHKEKKEHEKKKMKHKGHHKKK
jgi:hypothetical protein